VVPLGADLWGPTFPDSRSFFQFYTVPPPLYKVHAAYLSLFLRTIDGNLGLFCGFSGGRALIYKRILFCQYLVSDISAFPFQTENLWAEMTQCLRCRLRHPAFFFSSPMIDFNSDLTSMWSTNPEGSFFFSFPAFTVPRSRYSPAFPLPFKIWKTMRRRERSVIAKHVQGIALFSIKGVLTSFSTLSPGTEGPFLSIPPSPFSSRGLEAGEKMAVKITPFSRKDVPFLIVFLRLSRPRPRGGGPSKYTSSSSLRVFF